MKYLPLRIDYIVIDVVLALYTAYVIAIVVDGLILRPIRAARMKKQGLGDSN